MKQSPALFNLTLADVQVRFANWRKNKKHQKRIPDDLWTAAVLLSSEFSLHEISSSLHLAYNDLKKRVEAHNDSSAGSIAPSLDFIPIDLPPTPSAECIVEMEHRNGNKMRMHFKGNVDLDINSFTESFWSKSA